MVAQSKFSIEDHASEETACEALRRALHDCNMNAAHLIDARQRVAALERRDGILRELARSRLEDVREESQRVSFLKDYPWLTPGPAHSPRRVFINAIIRLFLSDMTRTWSTPDINQVLEKQGIHVDSKRIFNTLNHLASDGRIVRLARGHYRASIELRNFDASKVTEDMA